jgi:hypothetical protein
MNLTDSGYSNSEPDNEVSPVSQLDVATYVDQTAALLGLAIPLPVRAGVVANFEHVQKIAQPVIEFSLPETVESAATFEP